MRKKKKVAGLKLGEQLKQEGINRAANSHTSLLADARRIAVLLANTVHPRPISADDVAFWYATQTGRDMGRDLGPAAGSLFSGSSWTFTCDRKMSNRPRNHARELKLWVRSNNA